MFDIPKCLEQQWTTLFGVPVAVAGKEDKEDKEEEDTANGAPHLHLMLYHWVQSIWCDS